MQPEDCHAPYFEYHPFQMGSESRGNKVAPEDFNLEDPPELGPEVTCFLQGPVKSSEEEILSKTHEWQLFLSGSTRVVNYRGATMKELEE